MIRLMLGNTDDMASVLAPRLHGVLKAANVGIIALVDADPCLQILPIKSTVAALTVG